VGTKIEINDTLQLSIEQGFPADIFDIDKHLAKPISLADVGDRIFAFHDKSDPRQLQLDPVRVFFVQNIGGKWLFWGKVYIQSQTISKKLAQDGSWKNGDWVTSGTYKVIDIYEPDYQRLFTMREALPGKSYF
jgi:hypothetical protein